MNKYIEAGVKEPANETLEFDVENGPRGEGVDPIGAALSSALAKVKDRLVETGAPYDLSIDSDTSRVIIKMVDPESGEVEREFPEKSIIELSKRLEDITGSVLDTRT